MHPPSGIGSMRTVASAAAYDHARDDGKGLSMRCAESHTNGQRARWGLSSKVRRDERSERFSGRTQGAVGVLEGLAETAVGAEPHGDGQLGAHHPVEQALGGAG